MTGPEEQLLTTSEGVDEGSAASTAEGSGTGATPPGGTTAPPSEAPTPPDDLEAVTGEPSGPGQQLETGEG